VKLAILIYAALATLTVCAAVAQNSAMQEPQVVRCLPEVKS